MQMGICMIKQYHMKMNNNTKLMLGVLAGAAVGYLLGTMLAPKKGSDFRQGILDSLEELGDNVSDFVAEGRDKLAGLVNMGGSQENGSEVTGNAPNKQSVS